MMHSTICFVPSDGILHKPLLVHSILLFNDFKNWNPLTWNCLMIIRHRRRHRHRRPPIRPYLDPKRTIAFPCKVIWWMLHVYTQKTTNNRSTTALYCCPSTFIWIRFRHHLYCWPMANTDGFRRDKERLPIHIQTNRHHHRPHSFFCNLSPVLMSWISVWLVPNCIVDGGCPSFRNIFICHIWIRTWWSLWWMVYHCVGYRFEEHGLNELKWSVR